MKPTPTAALETRVDSAAEAGRSDAAARGQERERRVLISSVVGVLSKAVTVVGSLVTVPLAIAYLGNELYGVWMTLNSFVLMGAFADLGLGNGLMTLISQDYGRSDREAARRHASAALVMLSCVAVLVAAATAAALPMISWQKLLNLSPAADEAQVRAAFIALTACFVLGLPLATVTRIENGYQRAYVPNALSALTGLAGIGGLVLAIVLEAPLYWLVLSIAAGPVVAAAINGFLLFRAMPWVRPSLGAVRRDDVRLLLRTGLLYFVLQLAVAVGYQKDNLIIAQVLDPQVVAEYSVVSRLFGLSPLLLGFFLAPLWPAYGEAIARRDWRWVRKTLKRSVAIALSVNALACLVLLVAGQWIVTLWTKGAIVPSWGLMLSLAVWTVLTGLGGPFAMFLNGLNDVRFQIVTSLVMAVTSAGLAFLGAKHFGVAGVVLGTTVAQVGCIVIPSFGRIRRVLRTTMREA